MSNKNKILIAAAIVVLAVAADQALKIYIKTHFTLGETHEIWSWFCLCFVENNGMAFGIEWASKLLLTLFRIAAVGVLGWYIYRLVYINNTPTGFVFTIATLMGGAMGNIVDCIFYGKWFGYADWFYGRVVDMLYFPIIKNAAGECLFFRPVFNLADSCVTVSVILILIFYRHDLDKSLSKEDSGHTPTKTH